MLGFGVVYSFSVQRLDYLRGEIPSLQEVPHWLKFK